ncbi:MAG: hypothetical protein Q8M03_17145 [Legionella sp.]|nr:hypothetical protein [Legionella sp.]
MTIFLMIAKEQLRAKLNEGRNASATADNGWANTVVTAVGGKILGWGRDTTISAKKQNSIDDCKAALLVINDASDDEETSLVLGALIQKYESEAQMLKPVNFKKSNTGVAFEACHTIIRTLKIALARAHLLDIPVDDDPINLFRYQMGRYIWKTEVESSPLAEDKKAAILLNLTECMRTLHGLDKGIAEYTANRKIEVLKSIQALRRENAALCKAYSMKFPGGISLSFFATLNFDTEVFIPKLGDLENFACEAIKTINEGGLALASGSEPAVAASPM